MKRDDPAALLAACCSSSELAVLGLLDALGPLDATNLALAMQMPSAGARQVAERLVARGLLVLVWGAGRRPAYALASSLVDADPSGGRPQSLSSPSRKSLATISVFGNPRLNQS